MASIFTYDPNPPKVISPWGSSQETPATQPSLHGGTLESLGGLRVPPLTSLEDYGRRFLDAEPQLGPVEYKLHLLLRPRQKLAFSSTGDPSTDPRAPIQTPRARLQPTARGKHQVSSTPSVPSDQSRQNRLQHLTTQLLWRLQQSSPYHSSSKADAIVANFPEASDGHITIPRSAGQPLPGLEESQGAMYEIGVNDDGALIGLTSEEMSESVANLRAMAGSLGCTAKILRVVVVGSCQLGSTMLRDAVKPPKNATITKLEDLVVVEALVLPDTATRTDEHLVQGLKGRTAASQKNGFRPLAHSAQETEQLRIALTGITTSGKSSLLGTLLASTLDNARGKSRLNTLKHRHEIASGITSSVAHELLGYLPDEDNVVNYACDNVESWIDIHNIAQGGRLVLLTDSAGLPRFRRTIVRSLVAWRPHWTLCCIAAAYSRDNASTRVQHGASDGELVNGQLDAEHMLALSHLELCLKLGLPLVVVITKYDLATRQGLRAILSKVLDILKAAGRVPQLLTGVAAIESEDDLQSIPPEDMHKVRTLLESVSTEVASFVPIVLTSAVSGVGMTNLHALLRQLPLLPDRTSLAEYSQRSACVSPVLFDVDEVFIKNGHDQAERGDVVSAEHTFVLSGLLQRGDVRTGDELILGPFFESFGTFDPRPPLDGRRAASYPVTHHEMAIRRAPRNGVRRRRSSEDITDGPPKLKSSSIGTDTALGREWYRVRVVSLRNLRLPVHTSCEDQAATIGVTFLDDSLPATRPRKGMVLLQLDERQSNAATRIAACGSLQVIFDIDAYSVMEPGAQFNLYIAGIRALVKVITVGLLDTSNGHTGSNGDDDGELFELDGEASKRADAEDKKIEVMFQLLNSREYIEIGVKALIMPVQAAEGSAGLDGYVGWTSAVYG